jgi:4-amino-4-deoxy-L-arabinose transferase-like glycosyltransferase
MRELIRLHWPIAIMAAAGLALLLTHLGSDYLWEDEGDTAVLAQNILKYGVPRAWDGVTFIDSDSGARENQNLVMVSHPWLQYYLAAASFRLLGENAFAARLPFALFGWLTILLVYGFVWRISASRLASYCAAALLISSAPFFLYARQCRNYAPNMFFTCLLLWIFFEMKSARSCALFTLIAVLLFHTHPLGLVLVADLGLLAMIYSPFAGQRRWFFYAAPAILLLTVPWFAFARAGYAENSSITHSVPEFLARALQYAIECASVAPIIGIAVLLAICRRRSRAATKSRSDLDRLKSWLGKDFLAKGEHELLLVALLLLFSYGLVMALVQDGLSLWLLGIRATPALLPLAAMISGVLIARTSRGKIAVAIMLMLIFAFTKLPQLTPWTFWGGTPSRNDPEIVGLHVPTKIRDCVFYTEQWLLLRDLGRENPGTVHKLCDFLGQSAKANDLMITNYSWEPLYFYTRLPQALKILPEYPIFDLARRKGLPEYTFGVDHARWIIWRPFYEGYHGYRLNTVEKDINAAGGHWTQVAAIPESDWENRENILFRRFSGDVHLYAWSDFPPAQVFRVDWSDESHGAR